MNLTRGVPIYRLFAPRARHYRFDWAQSPVRLALVWNPLVTIFFVLAFSGPGEMFWPEVFRCYFISCTVSFTCALGVRAVHFAVLFLHRARARDMPAYGILWYMGVSAVFMVPGLWLGFALLTMAQRFIDIGWQEPSLESYRHGILIGVLISVVFLLFESWRESAQAERQSKARLQQLETENLRTQVQALSMQMDPHLLFNSLNTIAAMIPDSPRAAEDMVLRLSELYRTVLGTSRLNLHPLAAELALVDCYLAIEKARFGDRLAVRVTVEPGLSLESTRVPVLSLQPLVENAVKHGVSQKSEGGCIEIRIRTMSGSEHAGGELEREGGTAPDEDAGSCGVPPSTLRISVRDNGVGPGRSRAMGGAGLALDNFRARLALLYGPRASLHLRAAEPEGAEADLRLPLDADWRISSESSAILGPREQTLPRNVSHE